MNAEAVSVTVELTAKVERENTMGSLTTQKQIEDAMTNTEASMTFMRIRETANPLSLELPEGTTFNEWVEIGCKLCIGQQAVQWKIGDWWAFGDHRYGDRAKAAAEGIFGLSFSTLATYGAVARAFETCRRLQAVPFSAHQEVYALPSAEADALLDKAEREGLSTRDLRREVRALTAANDPGEATPAEPKEPTQTVQEAQRDALFAYEAVVEMFERWTSGERPDDRDRRLYESAKRFVADGYDNRRPVPADFEIIFVEQGRVDCEKWYNVGRKTIDRWLILSGKQRLKDRRQKYVEMNWSRDGETRYSRQTEREVKVDFEAIERQVAQAAADHIRQHQGFRIVSLGKNWQGPTSRVLTSAEVIAQAEQDGFDAGAIRGRFAR